MQNHNNADSQDQNRM